MDEHAFAVLEFDKICTFLESFAQSDKAQRLCQSKSVGQTVSHKAFHYLLEGERAGHYEIGGYGFQKKRHRGSKKPGQAVDQGIFSTP